MLSMITVADDLTGANVNVSLLAARGFSTATCAWHDKWDLNFFKDFDAVSINAASRLLSPEQAKKRINELIKLAILAKPKVISKRIDSTLRGNLGSELEGALNAMPPHTLAICVPGFPASGRICAGGYMLVDGIPLEHTDVAKDPANPINTSKVLELFATQTKMQLGLLELGTILQGSKAVFHKIQELKNQGCKAIICDSVTDADITAIAKAVSELDYPCLALDPGPFTMALTLELAETPRLKKNRVLLVVGSVMDIVRHQLEALNINIPGHLELVNCNYLIDMQYREQEIHRVVKVLLEADSSLRVCGVCTALHAEDIIPLESLAKKFNISIHEASERINTGLGEIAFQILKSAERNSLGGIFTSGGEVTLAVTRRLGALGFDVRDEVLPRAMYGRLIGGDFAAMPIITKGGFVGGTDAIVQCINYLFTKISTQTQEIL